MPPPPTDTVSGKPPPPGRGVRWWPALLILVLGGGTVVYLQWIADLSQQWRNIYTIETVVFTLALLLIWLLLFSRVAWRIRWLVFGVLALFIGSMSAMFEIRGVTGDLIPILQFRWARRPPRPARDPEAPVLFPASIQEETFPQFLGPHRDAVLARGPRLARDWTARPPEKVWEQTIGAGWSGFSVVGNRALTLEQHGDQELAVCYELLSGKVLWTHADTVRYFTTIAGEGPRTTPTIAGDKVLTLGGTGILNCLDLATGTLVWSKDIIKDNQSQVPDWGVAGSPLVLANLVIVNPGGRGGRSLVAYSLETGQFLWGGGDDDASYSSPCPAVLGGVSQILIFNQHAIFGHETATGRVLWNYPWDSSQPHVALPVVLEGGRVLVSSGYGVGSELLQIERTPDKFSVKKIWKTNRLKAKFNNLVTLGGYVYGLDDGVLACLDLASGQLKWKEGRYGHGQFLLVRDLLLITAENGRVVLIDPNPSERRELTKFQALEGKTWNPPALVGNLLLVRNDQHSACFRLPVVAP